MKSEKPALGKTPEAQPPQPEKASQEIATPQASTVNPAWAVEEIEAEFKSLVSGKMANGLSRGMAVDVATRQIQRDAARGKYDPDAAKKWLATVAQRAGFPLLGIR